MKKNIPILCYLIFVYLIIFVSCAGKQNDSKKTSNAKDSTVVENVVDSLDFVLPESEFEHRHWLSGEFYELNDDEIANAKEILSNHIDSILSLPESLQQAEFPMGSPFPLKKYARQYLAAKQKQGDIVVSVTLIATNEDGSLNTYCGKNYHKLIWEWGKGGGTTFGFAMINITKKEITSLSFNRPD